MKHHTVILPLLLPRLTDKAATQLVTLLHELIAGIEHHYAEQIHSHHKRQQKIRQHKKSQHAKFTDPPF